jgi:hypothetical protein
VCCVSLSRPRDGYLWYGHTVVETHSSIVETNMTDDMV